MNKKEVQMMKLNQEQRFQRIEYENKKKKGDINHEVNKSWLRFGRFQRFNRMFVRRISKLFKG